MATYKELYDGYFTEINNICEMLGKYVSVYRTLIDGANALNNIAFSKKKDIKKALRRANIMGDIIDELIEAIEQVDFCYLDYLQCKSGYITRNVPKDSVFSELGSGLFFAGQFNNINNIPEQYKTAFMNGLNNFGKNKNGGSDGGGSGSKADQNSGSGQDNQSPVGNDDIVYEDSEEEPPEEQVDERDVYDNDDIE